MHAKDCVMPVSRAEKQRAIDENFLAFMAKLPGLLRTDAGKTALLRNREIVGLYDSILSAQRAGAARFPDQMFSVQEITDEAVDLGIYSHAVHLG
jgi:hypothetical protein